MIFHLQIMFLYKLVLTFYLIKMKNIFIIIFLIASNFSAFGQEKKVINNKYIIVPQRFNFLNENDQYQTSSLTKFLLKKNGFTVILDSDEYPTELKNNPCKALTAIVSDKSSMFKTKVFIELKDCFNKIVYASKEGVSGLKEYKKSYQDAIRNAHANMSDIIYVAVTNKDIINLKKKNVAAVPLLSKKVEIIIPMVQKVGKVSINKDLKLRTTLYVQPKVNGFQLVDLKSEVVFLILNTRIKDVFIIKSKNGLLYKKEAIWVAEFYENGVLVEKKYEIKF